MLIDRQRPVRDVALDNSSRLQLDAESMNIAVDATTDDQLLRDNITMNLGTIGDEGT